MGRADFSYIWRDRKRTFLGLPWSFTTYFLTDTKFVTRVGFFNLAEDELDLYKVTDKKLMLPFWQRILHCGTIILYVRDTDTPTKEVRCIKNPRRVLALLDKQIDIQRDRWHTRGRDMYGTAGVHCHSDEEDADYDPDCQDAYEADDQEPFDDDDMQA